MQLWLASAVALLIRLCTGLHPYSGYNDPPKYGDFEAQRHWMEITINTPVSEWYIETPNNNLSYWPLDYPPLSGYQSWIHGKVISQFDPKALELGTSHGYETYYSKLLMRWSVVWSDLLVFFPAVIACALIYSRTQQRGDNEDKQGAAKGPAAPLPASTAQQQAHKADQAGAAKGAQSQSLQAPAPAPATASTPQKQGDKASSQGGAAKGAQPPQAPAPASTAQQQAAMLLILSASLLQPALVITDHGHFQYNCISLGFAAGAAASIMSGWDVVGSVLFCLSLNHKQMSLFYAPAFFGHLLGKCLQRPSIGGKVAAVAKLGVTVITTFAVCWAPFLTSKDMALAVLGRILPVKRGLYEDYVANFWCATSVAVKWKLLLEQPVLMKLCAAAVLAAAAPSMLHQMARPSARGLLLCMVNSGMAFYMFSYQVHEKSILLPLMPLMLMAPDHPHLGTYLPVVASFSMFPLLERDGLTIAYIGTILMYIPAMILATNSFAGYKTGWSKSLSNKGIGSVVGSMAAVGCQPWVTSGLAFGMIGLHVAKAWLPAPARLPWLYDRAFISLSFVVFAAVMVYLNAVQWALLDGAPATTKTSRRAKQQAGRLKKET